MQANFSKLDCLPISFKELLHNDFVNQGFCQDPEILGRGGMLAGGSRIGSPEGIENFKIFPQ